MKIWLLLALALPAQSVTLPKEISAEPKDLIMVPFTVDGGTPKWKVDPGLTEIPIEALVGPEAAAKATVRLFKTPKLASGVKSQKFQIWAWNAKADKVSDLATCTVTVSIDGDTPTPTPPTPTPQTSEFFMSIWYQSTERTPAQAAVILSTNWRTYVRDKKSEYRLYDVDVDPQKTKEFRPILDKTGMPAVVIQKMTGELIDAIPLPDSEEKLLEYLRKFGG